MASDLSSGCTDDIDIFEEKEEGELSLEDVSSSEESHPNYRSGYRRGRDTDRCTSCLALRICPPWCHQAAARAATKIHKKQDAAHGKENRRHMKDPSSTVSKHMIVATLQEKNDDLVPISSDSDMEIVGLPGNSKHEIRTRSKSAKIRKKKKKKRNHSDVVRIEDDSLPPSQLESSLVDVPVVKKVRTSRSHHREPSPARYSARSPLERTLPKSPSRRYRTARSMKLRSALQRSRSPGTRVNAALEKKSPRKLRSPRRSPAPRSPVRATLFRDARNHGSPTTSQTHIDIYASKLLQKVRRLESVGGSSTKDLSKNKEHSSLKEKLSNMMKNQAEVSHEKPIMRKENNTNVINNNNNKSGAATAAAAAAVASDDEDDIEVLRRLALETKQKKSEKKIDESKIKSESANANESDDNDVEANELRILALRSAIMKKHEKRVTRGMKSKRIGKSATRAESPFNESFLEDIDIPGEKDESIKARDPAASFSPILDYESNHPEDMDIDTDVEREKEKDFMPYSPTDDLTREIVMEVESIETNGLINNEDERFSVTSVRGKNVTSERNTSPENSDYTAGVDTPYSPSAPIETPELHKFVSHSSVNKRIEEIPEIPENPLSSNNSDCTSDKVISFYLPGVDNDTSFSPVGTMESHPQSEKTLAQLKNITTTESPYSPTDTPILDPHLFPIFPNLPAVVQPTIESTEKNDENVISSSKIGQVQVIAEVVASEKLKNNLQPQQVDKCKSPSTNDRHFDFPIRDNFEAVDTLPEVDLDGSPLVPVSKELECAELGIPIEISPEIRDIASEEPLYLQCLSDVTKDTNKIPTLVNRTLVPAHILKTNKQLQQPLPLKKVDSHTEPSFKSAEMRPVSVETTQIKLPTMFKPIKLCPILKKPQVMTTIAAAAFNLSFGEESSIKETKSDDEIRNVDVPTLTQEPKTIISCSPVFQKSHKADDDTEQKKKTNATIKKLKKLRGKRKSSAESPSSESNRSSLDDRGESRHNTDLSDVSEKRDKSVAGSASDFKGNVPKKDKNTECEATNITTGDTVTTSKVETGHGKKKKRRRAGRKFQQRKIASIARETRSKSSDLDVTKSAEQTLDDTSCEKDQMESYKSEGDRSKDVETSKTEDESEKERRCSIDEDEEALRAQLLASLPKRTKLVETGVSTPPENPSTIIHLPLDTTPDMSGENSTNKANTSTASVADVVGSVNPLTLSTESSGAISVTQAQVPDVATTEESQVAKKMVGSKLNSSSDQESPLTPRKRASSVLFRGPPKKMIKKALPVLASTKVVNNAKKYQNALTQKKLNLQRNAMNYGGQNGSRNITLNNLKNNDSARPSSPKISAASKTQRLVINLGSDTDSETELESGKPANSNSGIGREGGRKPLAIPTNDFERSLEKFLKDQRKKQESVTVSRAPPPPPPMPIPTTTTTTTTSKTVANTASPVAGKLSGLYNTPLAVRRHLPVSQQEEYRRLKQQIAEREREKLRKTIENGSVSSQKSPCTPPGPLSPASAIAGMQKSQTNNKATGAANESATSSVASSNKDKLSEKPIVQKKIELVKANDNRLAINVTKASKVIVPAIPNKQITKPLVASSKVYSSIPNIPPTASVSKASVKKVVPNASSCNSSPNSAAITSTPKAQSSISSKTHSGILSRAFLPHAKNAAPPAENSGEVGAESPSTWTKISLESSTRITTAEKYCQSLDTTSVASLPTTVIATSASGSSLKATEMLTIQIPNDKIQTDRLAFTRISRGESGSPPNGRNVGMLKILTKEQLNSRFVHIKVKQSPAGRTVTVGGSALSQDNATRSASSSPIPRVSCQARSDKSEKKTCCDSSLIVNQSTATRRSVANTEESNVDDSEASTLVLSRDEASSGHALDSEVSTLVVDHEDAHNERTANSEASTLVLGHDISEGRESPGLVRTEESEDGTLAASTGGGLKQTKPQVKQLWEKIRSDVKNELEILTALPADQQRSILIESQENLVAKRNMILDDLTEMSGCLRQWEVEREIQTKLIAEVRRLREQLRTAEKHLHEQRRQMNSMGPKVTKAHEKINHGRRECYKLSRICHGLGSKLIGEEYKVPDTGAQLLNERLKEVAVHTRQLSKKKVPPIGGLNDSRDTTSPTSSTGSDTVSEMSFVERPSNPTTPLLLSYAPNIAIATNFVASETYANRITGEYSAPPETSTADPTAFLNNSIFAVTHVTTEEKARISEADASSENTTAFKSMEKYAQEKEDNDGSSSSEMNAQMSDKMESDLLKSDAQTNTKQVSSASKCNTNSHSDVPNTNLFNIDRYEDNSMPTTSKSYPRCELLSSDDRPPIKSKIDPYESVLTHFKAPRSVNPDGVLCPYEMRGTCSDGDCQYYHLDPGHCQ